MTIETGIYLVVAVLGLLLPIRATRWESKESECAKVHRDDALEAVKLMKDWGVWLAGIQTAAIAALGAFFKGSPFPTSAKLAVVFFTASIVADTILLAGLPSIALRLKRAATGIQKDAAEGNQQPGSELPINDIYELPTFAASAYGRRAGGVYVVSHVYFGLGIAAFAFTFALAPKP